MSHSDALPHAFRRLSGLASASRRLPRLVFSLAILARQRRALADLDPWLLKDAGIDPAAARRETGRAFWDVPAHWRI